MTLDLIEEGWISYCWQVCLHSAFAALLLSAWARKLRFPAGRTRRFLYAVVLLLPLLTAAVPGRSDLAFREHLAIFDSHRFLHLPIAFSLRIGHVVVVLLAATVFLTLWQEALPLWRRRRSERSEASEELLASVASIEGWQPHRVEICANPHLEVVTAGWPGHQRLIVCQGALEGFTKEELLAVLHHEHAHWKAGRWWSTHLLYGVRLLQFFNPVALWAFREYIVESEIACDQHASTESSPITLSRALLEVYRHTDDREWAARSVLRKRIDVLTGEVAFEQEHLGRLDLAYVPALLALTLPWTL